jgi:hypothetical protein
MLHSEQKNKQNNSYLILSLEIVFFGKLILDVQNNQAAVEILFMGKWQYT